MPFLPPPPLPAFLARQLPFNRRAYRLEAGQDAGLLLHFIDHGDPAARPVLLLHGNPTWSFLWRKVIAAVSEPRPGLQPRESQQPQLSPRPPKRFMPLRSVAPDLLGFGLSDKPRRIGDHSLARHGAAISELVEALDLRGIVLVGQDWGGPIAALVGARCPERVAGLVFANTSVLLPRRPGRSFFHRFARVPGLSDLAFRGFGFPLGILRWVQGDRRSMGAEVARAYRYPLRSWNERVAPLALARMVPAGAGHPSLPALARAETWARSFTGPVALVWGTRDPVLGRALARHERAFPQARVIRTEAGHFLQEEVPETLAEAIAEVARLADLAAQTGP
jgi:pimeloyl-ACP methyl ester carboxylesterase